MSNIILARLSASYDRRADLRVYSFDVAQDSDDGIRKALCGFSAHHSVLEFVPELTGLGCELCIAETPVEAQDTPSSETSPPEDDPTSAALYAVRLSA